jgi:hypothetical protein
MNSLIPARASAPGSAKTVQLYEKMQTAIGACFSFGECKAIAGQAAAIAAYHKQIQDETSMKQFLEIKIRAWRRIGEIFDAVDTSACETFAARARKIRAAFEAEVEKMSDAHIKQALDAAALPLDFFETNIGEIANISRFLEAYQQLQREQWAASPEGQEEARLQAERRAAWEAQNAAKEARRRQKGAEDEKRAEEDARLIDTLMASHAEAVREDGKAHERPVRDAYGRADPPNEGVGITLGRRDRTAMHSMVFLLKASVYEVLRQAAFDKRITMHAVLREGLAMWFEKHGYHAPMHEMDMRTRTTAATRHKLLNQILAENETLPG